MNQLLASQAQNKKPNQNKCKDTIPSQLFQVWFGFLNLQEIKGLDNFFINTELPSTAFIQAS